MIAVMELIGNNPITADGTYTIPVEPGQAYVFSASSAAWAGTLAVKWPDAGGNLTAFEESPLSANGGFWFIAPNSPISIIASDAMTCYISLVPVKQ